MVLKIGIDLERKKEECERGDAVLVREHIECRALVMTSTYAVKDIIVLFFQPQKS